MFATITFVWIGLEDEFTLSSVSDFKDRKARDEWTVGWFGAYMKWMDG